MVLAQQAEESRRCHHIQLIEAAGRPSGIKLGADMGCEFVRSIDLMGLFVAYAVSTGWSLITPPPCR